MTPAWRVQTVRVGKLCTQTPTNYGQIEWSDFLRNQIDSLSESNQSDSQNGIRW